MAVTSETAGGGAKGCGAASGSAAGNEDFTSSGFAKTSSAAALPDPFSLLADFWPLTSDFCFIVAAIAAIGVMKILNESKQAKNTLRLGDV